MRMLLKNKKRKKSKVINTIIVIFIFLVLFVIIFINYYSNKSRDVLMAYAEAETRKLTVLVINKAITKQMSDSWADDIFDIVYNDKGEIVLIIDGATTKEIKSDLISLSVQDHMNHYLEQGMDEKEAMKSVAKDRGVSKSIIYQQIKRK